MLRTKLIRVLSGAAVMLCLAAAEARACRCFMREEPCSLYWSADVVFAGTVTEVGPLLPVEGRPGVLTSGGRATRLSVTDGAAHEAEEFRLPPPLVARELEGGVVWPDGRPAPSAMLTVEFAERGGLETTGAADEQGHFRLKVYEGLTYFLSAESRAQNAGGVWVGRHSREVELTVGETNEPVRLVIDREGFYIPRHARPKQEKQK